MLVRTVPLLAAVTSATLLLFFAPPAQAAEFTDLLSAADDLDDGDPDTYNPWDFHIEPSFTFDYSTAQISREAPCVPHDYPTADDYPEMDSEQLGDYSDFVHSNPRLISERGRCDEPTIVYNNEMMYRQLRHTLDLELRAGLYKDLELRVNFPYVINSSRGLRYHDDVDETNSSVDPATGDIRDHGEDVFDDGVDYQQERGAYASALDQYQMYRFMELDDDFRNYDRSGMGDPSVGIHWAPWSDYRDDTKATMVVGMDYVMPIAPIQKADNDAVGEGLHKLEWNLAASKRFDWIEPYFGARYTLPIPATDSLYGDVHEGSGDEGAGQVVTNPPHEGMFTIGTEFIPYEDPEIGARYGVDLRFEFGYTSEGRDYTPLFDHMTADDNHCNGKRLSDVQPSFDDQGTLENPDDVACSWVVQQPSNTAPPEYNLRDTDANTQFQFDDLMTVDDYGTFSGMLGVYLQPTEYFQFRTTASLTHHQSHLLTNARTGRNTEHTDEDTVDMNDPRERNPAYNPAYDNSGDRFRVERFNTWQLSATLAVQF